MRTTRRKSVSWFNHGRDAHHSGPGYPLASYNSNRDGPDKLPPYEYKDDCFGFMSFLGGFAAQDVVFTGIFVALSLTGAIACQLQLIPRDTKRPTIVDRKIPALVAAITLIMSSLISDATAFDSATNELARSIQLGVGGFSIVTGLFDIRWRDRFDYPQD